MSDPILVDLKRINRAIVTRAWKAMPKDDTDLVEAFNGWQGAVEIMWKHPQNPRARESADLHAENIATLLKQKGITHL